MMNKAFEAELSHVCTCLLIAAIIPWRGDHDTTTDCSQNYLTAPVTQSSPFFSFLLHIYFQ